MTEQMHLMEVRDEAITRVDRNADDAWKHAALTAVRAMATQRRLFTAEDVLLSMPGDVSTHENRAMGPVMLRAKAAGLVHPTDRTVTSRRPECHMSLLRVWESRIYRSGEASA